MTKGIFRILVLGAMVLSGCSTPQKPVISAPEAPRKTLLPHKGAVLAGDYPDPSVVKVGNSYWAVSTSSQWAPPFPIFKSVDLVNWRLMGNVFSHRPEWTSGNYWAPEIAKMGDTYFIYFAAKNKKLGSLCVGVGTSKAPDGPYQDHGPLICQGPGSIDPAPVVDEKGNKYLVWKEDGNSQNKPTPLWIQRLAKSGTKLVGSKTQLIRNDAPWENQLVEGPYLLKHGDYWYLFYSGNSCCTNTCNYAVGMARAKNLLGPWEKNPGNPILKGNEIWKCPGHGSIVQDTEGRDVLLYHAYHAKDSVYVGRQAMADQIDWKKDGWATINEGLGPGLHVKGFLNVPLRNEEHRFSDLFSNAKLAPGWQLPQSDEPEMHVDQAAHLLVLNGKSKAGDPLGAVLARSTTTGNYDARIIIDTSKTKPGSLAGLSAYGDADNALGLSYGDHLLHLWIKKKGQTTDVKTWPAPNGKDLHLQMLARQGHLFQFSTSTDGKTWSRVENELNGDFLPPWDLGVRVALTAGHGEASFASQSIEPLAQE